MNELALFAGAGGGILGGKLLGWRTVCGVERDAYAAQILAQRQNDGILEPFPIWSDVCSFNGKPWRGIVDVISGGFPCQDISAAGKGAGIEGSRSGMWKEMARIIGEVRPKYAFVENSPMLTTRGLGVVLADLAAMGFDAEWGVLSAADVGANHQRERIWIVARQRNIFSHTPNTTGMDGGSNSRKALKKRMEQWPTPRACTAMAAPFTENTAKAKFPNLETVVAQRFETPTARMWKDNGKSPSELNRNSETLAMQAGGALNPNWVEWLMGWPIGWTDLNPLETDKSHCALQQHSSCLKVG